MALTIHKYTSHAVLGTQHSTAQSSCLDAWWPMWQQSHAGEQRSCQGKQLLNMNASYIPPQLQSST